jgi:hypothetical protein
VAFFSHILKSDGIITRGGPKMYMNYLYYRSHKGLSKALKGNIKICITFFLRDSLSRFSTLGFFFHQTKPLLNQRLKRFEYRFVFAEIFDYENSPTFNFILIDEQNGGSKLVKKSHETVSLIVKSGIRNKS